MTHASLARCRLSYGCPTRCRLSYVCPTRCRLSYGCPTMPIGAGFWLTRRSPVADMACARSGPRAHTHTHTRTHTLDNVEKEEG